MSSHLATLVLTLTPQPTGYHHSSSHHGRDRHVLLTLATLADDHGTITDTSVAQLAAYTQRLRGAIRDSLNHLHRLGYLTWNSPTPGGANDYHLNPDTLHTNQLGYRHGDDTVYYLRQHHNLITAAVNRLRTEGYPTMSSLVTLIDRYHQLDPHTRPELHHWLDWKSIGATNAQRIRDGVKAWRETT